MRWVVSGLILSLCIRGALSYRPEHSRPSLHPSFQSDAELQPESRQSSQVKNQRQEADPKKHGLPMAPIKVTAHAGSSSSASREQAADGNGTNPKVTELGDTAPNASALLSSQEMQVVQAIGGEDFERQGPGVGPGELIPVLQKLEALSNISFGIDSFGVPLPLPLPENGTCMARALVFHFEGVKDQLTDKAENANFNELMVALILGSSTVLILGHMLVTPVMAAVSGAISFYAAFIVLLYVSSSCDIPVYGGLLATLPAMAMAVKIVSFGFFSVGAALGAVFAVEGKMLAYSLAPGMMEKLEEEHMMRYYWVFCTLVGLICGLAMVSQVQNIFMLATAMIGAFGLKVGLNGLMSAHTEKGMSEIEGLMCVAGFFFVGVVAQYNIAKFWNKRAGQSV